MPKSITIETAENLLGQYLKSLLCKQRKQVLFCGLNDNTL